MTVNNRVPRREGSANMPPRRRTKPRSDLHRALGEAVEELRKEAELTHEEFASRPEMSFQPISELERGRAWYSTTPTTRS
jgi:hypothetical protein